MRLTKFRALYPGADLLVHATMDEIDDMEQDR